MRGPDPTDWRPSPAHDALLRVALAPAEDVGPMWARHRAALAVDRLGTLDWAARRLVPLVAWRLQEAAVTDVAMPALRADLALSMVAARVKRASFAAVLDALDAAGIEALVLKGVGVAPLAYPDPGTRPVSDLDVLVRPAQLTALDALVAARSGSVPDLDVLPVARSPYRHGADVTLDGTLVDVHWRLLVDRFDPAPDVELFLRSRPVDVGGRTTRTLSIEDHLVHAVAHGVRRNTLAPVRWIADVGRLVACLPVDWTVVEEQADRRSVAGVVSQALDLVRRDYGVAVPDATIRRLRRAGGNVRRRTDLWSRSPKRTRVAGALNAGFVHYVLATAGLPGRERVARYPGYLRFRMTVGEGPPAPTPAGADWHG